MCVFHLPCSMHFDARSTHLMSVFSFVQQVARYEEATYPLHASVFIRATRYMKCGEWCFDIVYLW